jgi:glycosyltransferase involved in cell wall biosynthesis
MLVAAWCAGCVRLVTRIRACRLLADERPASPSTWPRLSVVVAACNEASTLEAALATLLAQDYPELEIVVIDDRSTDGTAEIVDRLAARDPRVRAVHVRELPDGWLGKVHALHVGAARATGDWVLFTDADVHLAPGVLRRAIAVCLTDELDHLAVLPDARAGTLVEEIAVDAMGQIFLEKHGAGVGAFNLVRRSAFARTAGFSWLRMEVLDDVGLGELMRQAGAQSEPLAP